MEQGSILFAFTITLFAGLSTGVGSILAFFSKKTNTKFLSGALGFSAGVMIYVSLVEIFVKANDSLQDVLGASTGYQVTTLSFFIGIALIALIDFLVPSFENPHEAHRIEEIDCNQKASTTQEDEIAQKPDSELKNVKSISDKAEKTLPPQKALLRMGLFSALAIAIHNFPEGLATFTGALKDPALGISIAVAIAIHNIPEGIAVSVPIYHSTGSRKKAFGLSVLSGLSEPVGALVGYVLLYNFFNDMIFGILFAMVAGIMVYISLDELLPTAEEYGEHHIAILGVIAGMIVMAISLILFA